MRKLGSNKSKDISRKHRRKKIRDQKKINRREHYMKKKINDSTIHSAGKFVKRLPETLHADGDSKLKENVKSQQPNAYEILKRQTEKEKKIALNLQVKMEEQRRKILLKENEDEDKIIRKLEKRLGLNKTKNIKNLFTDDGLDYLLEVCDRTTQKQVVAAKKHLADINEESDFEEDLSAVTGKAAETKNKSADIVDDDTLNNGDDNAEPNNSYGDESDSNNDDYIEDDDNEDLGQSEDEEMYQSKAMKRKLRGNKVVEKKSKYDDVDLDESIENSSNSGEEIINDVDNAAEQKYEDNTWEDIYGRKRDKEGKIIKEEKGIYIPPHLRNKDSTTDKELVLLKRQIKGVLNKLAGTNLHWAASTMENLYSNNSRNAVNTSLSDLWIDALVQSSTTPDRMIAEHVAFVSVLQANVGTEIGAHFLQVLVKKFDEMVKIDSIVENKELDNLTCALAYLYSFKIYHALLLYDIMNSLLEKLNEKNIECVLVALRCVGGVLRKEEPIVLKNFIHETQVRVGGLTENSSNGSRIKFLLDVLLAIKNNNLAKIPNYDPTYSEHLKKLTKGIIRKGNYITTLNIRLEDLLKADERGKWWVVGSAWEGNRINEKDKETDKKFIPSTDQKLLELARKQRMNTDIRRSIFCIIMSAEDYMDAFEKLQHLGLKSKQEREIIHVLLACCLQEKEFNPYYAILAQKLCDYDRKYQLSIQYSIWDKIRDLESSSKVVVSNIAQLLIHLIMEKGLPLSVLKVIEFSDLTKTTVRFMREILLAIIMNSDFQSTLEVFQRIGVSPKLHMFRESIKLFIQHFIVGNTGKKNCILSEGEMETLRQRSLDVNKILTMYDTKLKF